MSRNMPRGASTNVASRFFLVWIATWLILLATPTTLFAQGTDSPATFLPLISAQEGTTWRWSLTDAIELSPRPHNGPVTVVDHLGQTHLFWDTLNSPRFLYHAYHSVAGWVAPSP